jgi:hypothetical protein
MANGCKPVFINGAKLNLKVCQQLLFNMKAGLNMWNQTFERFV